MTDTATLARAPARRPAAREPVAPEREPDRPTARPGALTFKHPVTGEMLVRDPQPKDTSPFRIRPEIVPEGMVYQWRRESLIGEPDTAHIATLRRNGWREVPADRHPDQPVRLEGLILMECPAIFVEASNAEDRKAALAERAKGRPRNEALRPGYFDDSVPAVRASNYGARRGAPEATDPTLRPVYQREGVSIDP